jgi:colanic acid biosynthesis glycosyl transferase WcaI
MECKVFIASNSIPRKQSALRRQLSLQNRRECYAVGIRAAWSSIVRHHNGPGSLARKKNSNSQQRGASKQDEDDNLAARRSLSFVLLTEYFHPEIGAAQTRLRFLVAELLRAGHKVDVVTALPHYPSPKYFRQYRGRLYVREKYGTADVHRVWILPTAGTGLARVFGYLSFTITSIAGLIKCKTPDVLLVESPPLMLSLSGWLYSRLCRIPFVLNVADLWPDVAEAYGVVRNRFLLKMGRLLERWSYSQATLVTTVTQGLYEYLRDIKGVNESKLLLLPNGVDTTLFAPLKPDRKLLEQLNPDNRHVVLYAGTHGIAHGMDIIVEAAKILRNEPMRFVLLGDGTDKNRLLALAAKEGLSNLTFVDPVSLETLPRFYAIADAALVTLRSGDMSKRIRPAKMFVAMACGLPVILVGEGEAASILQEARAGVIVPPDNPGALAQAIRECLKVPNYRSYGVNGRNFVLKHLRWNKIVPCWLAELRGRLGIGGELS